MEKWTTCQGCIARGDEESREAVFESGALQCLQAGLEFCTEPLVQQEQALKEAQRLAVATGAASEKQGKAFWTIKAARG